jgi:hypothetical protein
MPQGCFGVSESTAVNGLTVAVAIAEAGRPPIGADARRGGQNSERLTASRTRQHTPPDASAPWESGNSSMGERAECAQRAVRR